jgi:dolichol-phosphate mannosyltransferase
MKTLSVVIPVFNNSATLDELFLRLSTTLNAASVNWEVILIDDGSKDDSWIKIERLSKLYESCRGVRLTRNFGQHPAIRAGLERSRGEIIILMDADLEDKPEETVKLLHAFSENPRTQVVYSVAEYDDGSQGRLSSRIFRKFFNRATKNDLPEGIGTLRAFTEFVRDEILKYPERSAIYGPLMVEMGFKYVYVSVSRSASRRGSSSYTPFKRLELGVSALVMYSKRFYYSLVATGLLVGLFAGVYLFSVTVQYLLGYRELIEGQILLLIVSLLGFSTLLILLGVSFVYLSSIHREVLSRPYFHIDCEIGDEQGISK